MIKMVARWLLLRICSAGPSETSTPKIPLLTIYSRLNHYFYCTTSVLPQFDVILTGQSIYGTIFMIPGHLQGQKVNSKVKN